MQLNFLKWIAMACIVSLLTMQANASVVITGTRVIYPADARDVTVKLNNNGTAPALIQAWVDDGDTSVAAQQRPMPFTLTPPVFRIDPEKGQMLRVIYTQAGLPTDRESVYYLNVFEIPPKFEREDRQNVLQMAFRTRIKLFYRPKGLVGDPNDAPAKVTWSFARSADDKQIVLLAKNPTPYHVSVTRASIQAGDKTHESAPGMIAPFGQREFVLEGLQKAPEGPVRVRFETINDFGANVSATYPAESR
ncbi:MAG: fimbria/pilus periplasmic chaperone [Betaproteobacteria bacterium]|nr:fimbria/pilus periplasmic chaperone [Betaproteobacteria bacterium]